MGFEEDYSKLQQVKRESDSSRGEYIPAFQRFTEFAEKYFGQADPVTLKERKEINDLGFSVVSSNDLSHKQVLEVLSSVETQRILASSREAEARFN